jgi:serine/threonine protein kinase
MERWLRGLGRPPNEGELRAILWPLLSGLERVHQAGFLHRDIKPENIYLTAGGRPVLLDFGSARQAIGGRSRMLTAVITAGYAPFEQYHEGGQAVALDRHLCGGGVLRSNKQYGLAYNESSKPQLAGLKPMRVTKLVKSTVTTNSNSNSTTSAEGLKARSINTEKV